MSNSSLFTPPIFALTRFELEVDSGSSRLYANGLQQVDVLITVSAIDPTTFESYTLTPSDFSTLALIEYNADGVLLPIVSDETAVATGWAYALAENRYTAYPSTLDDVSTAPKKLEDDVLINQFKTFYVQTVATNQLKIGAQIWGGETDEKGNRVFITTNAESTIKDSVTLIPQSVPLYSKENLVFTATQIEGDSTSPFGWDSVDYYSFSLRPQSGAGAFLNIVTPPKGMSMFDVAPAERGSCIGWADIGSKAVSYFATSAMNHKTLVAGYPEVGKGTLVLVRRDKLTLSNPPGRPDSITLRDEYGNDYTIPFNFGTTRSTLIFI